jgi:hypothetical protein
MTEGKSPYRVGQEPTLSYGPPEIEQTPPCPDCAARAVTSRPPPDEIRASELARTGPISLTVIAIPGCTVHRS